MTLVWVFPFFPKAKPVNLPGEGKMRKALRSCVTLIGAGLLIIGSGCQTWVPTAGVTLPSGHYLEHPPQYIQPSPSFPLPKELANLEEAALQQTEPQALPPLPGR